MVQIPKLCPGNMFITYLPAISGGQTSTTESITTGEQNNHILDNSKITNDFNGMTPKRKDSPGALPTVTPVVETARTVISLGCKNTQENNPQVISSNLNEKRKSKSDQENNQTTQTFSNNSKPHKVDEIGSHSTEVNNLELSTLTSLYQESRRRIFGEEWVKRKTSAPVQRKEDVGCTGVSKPRKLSPLSAMPPGKNTTRRESITPPIKPFSRDSQLFSQLPAPGGLHLSANFMSFRDMECSLNSSRGSRRSFRRNNSMSEISAKSIDEGVFNPQSIHRTSSAPDIHKKGKKEDGETSTPPMITPARANTPTEPSKSAKVIRPQLIGGSLATCSPDQTISFSSNSNINILEDLPTSKQLNTPTEFPPLIANRTLHTSPPDIVPSEMRPMRRSLPARLSISSHGKVTSDPFGSYLSAEQKLPPKSSRQRLTPLNNPNKKFSLP
ncbi:UNVERIFIED_CONTAM: hypothetical protein RMT77_009971 [Armadillidium vulgare]